MGFNSHNTLIYKAFKDTKQATGLMVFFVLLHFLNQIVTNV